MTDLVAAGPNNLITDVAGLSVGNAEDALVRTGVTVLLSTGTGEHAGFRAAVEQRGGAPGTRETDALKPGALVKAIDAIVLSGGSAFGLDAAGGVQSWLAARSLGYRIHQAVVPIVPAAILFDLANGGVKDWGETPPYRALGQAACDAASDRFALGNAGAGYGATAGLHKGGLGSASAVDPVSGFTVAGLMAVNSFGSPVTPDGKTLWAAPYELAGEFGDLPTPSGKTGGAMVTKSKADPRGNTTIGVAATDAPLSDDQLARFAVMAADGLPRAIQPVHTAFDGDLIFAVCTGETAGGDGAVDPMALTRLGSLAADAVARSIGRAMTEAQDLGTATAFPNPADRL
ncbi:MAG: P1 family peptidase [Alphaproteobacteria bacterium]|nr:P1 family peptidase [Alphaproteobacteria bacterium]